MNIQFILILSLFLFFIGFFGVYFYGYRIIIFLMCIELMWLGVGMLFLSTSLITHSPYGLVFTIVILSVAAAETAVGLALLVGFYRSFKTLELTQLVNLRG